MRAYKAPGIYSTFVPAQETVNGGRSLRRLAIVGPGQKFFVRENVAVERSEKAIFDELENDGLIDIISASSCKIKNGKPTIILSLLKLYFSFSKSIFNFFNPSSNVSPFKLSRFRFLPSLFIPRMETIFILSSSSKFMLGFISKDTKA